MSNSKADGQIPSDEKFYCTVCNQACGDVFYGLSAHTEQLLSDDSYSVTDACATDICCCPQCMEKAKATLGQRVSLSRHVDYHVGNCAVCNSRVDRRRAHQTILFSRDRLVNRNIIQREVAYVLAVFCENPDCQSRYAELL